MISAKVDEKRLDFPVYILGEGEENVDDEESLGENECTFISTNFRFSYNSVNKSFSLDGILLFFLLSDVIILIQTFFKFTYLSTHY